MVALTTVEDETKWFATQTASPLQTLRAIASVESIHNEDNQTIIVDREKIAQEEQKQLQIDPFQVSSSIVQLQSHYSGRQSCLR